MYVNRVFAIDKYICQTKKNLYTYKKHIYTIHNCIFKLKQLKICKA